MTSPFASEFSQMQESDSQRDVYTDLKSRGGGGVGFRFPNSCDFEAELSRSSHSQATRNP